MKKPEADLARAQYEALQARKSLASTAAALQYRLKPQTIVNTAWEGVRDRSSLMADDALQVVKDRPGAASGVMAALVIFLARNPLLRLLSRIFSRKRREDKAIVKANLDNDKGNFDLTAPTVERSLSEGVSA